MFLWSCTTVAIVITILNPITSDGARCKSSMFLDKVFFEIRPGNFCGSYLTFFLIRWVLLDFDLAEHARDEEKDTSVIIGTDGFMAPEAYHGVRSSKSDIFSLGACVIDMCSDLQGIFFLW